MFDEAARQPIGCLGHGWRSRQSALGHLLGGGEEVDTFNLDLNRPAVSAQQLD